MPSLLDKGFSKITVDIATLSVVMLFLDEVRIRISNFRSHRLYLNAVLGMGSGASIALLIVLTGFQVVACTVVTFLSLYNKLGTAMPSVSLGTTLACEMILYHGFGDTELALKALSRRFQGPHWTSQRRRENAPRCFGNSICGLCNRS